MDEERGDLREEVGVVEAGSEGLDVERGSWSETGSWFHRQDEAYQMEQSVIDREDVGG